MTKIETLTDSQKALLPVYRDRWLKIGLAPGPADRPKAEDAIRRAYQIVGLAPPKQIVWSTSPLSGWLTVCCLRNDDLMKKIYADFLEHLKVPVETAKSLEPWTSVADSVGHSVRNSVADSVGHSVRDSMVASVWDSVRNSVVNSVRNSVADSVGHSVRDSMVASVWDSVRNSVWDSVCDSVRNSVWDSVRNSVGDSVRVSVWASVADSVVDSVVDSVGASVVDSVKTFDFSETCFGSHDANWLGFYQYFLEVLKIEACEKLLPLMDLSKEGGWFYPYQNICVISERPCEIHMDGTQIHRDGGPAIHYMDGFAVYALHGVQIPEWLVMTPKEELDSTKILALPNAQQRAEGVKKIGISAMLSALKWERIDKMDGYELGSIEYEGRRIGPYLSMQNPSTGERHVEGVGTPNGGVDETVKTCEQALSWRNGTKTYIKPEIIT